MNSNYRTLWGEDTSEIGEGKEYRGYRHKWHTYPKDGTVADFPLFLDIEASAYCNLRCPHCIQTDSQFEKGIMPMDMFQRVIDEASDNGCYGCKFHTIGRGEPLTNPWLPKMIAYAKKKGLIDVYLNTNGVLLSASIWRGPLLDAGLDRISISVDGLGEDYNRYRSGGNFWALTETVERFFNLRNVFGYKTKIRIQTVDLGFSLEYLERYARYWSLWCDEVGVVKFKDMVNRKYGVKDSWICPQPWQRMSVLWDGSILPCNHDDRQYARLGTFPEMSLKKAWHGPGMRLIREAYRRGQGHFIGACDGCFLRTSEIKGGKGK